jgi:hypothetical protein
MKLRFSPHSAFENVDPLLNLIETQLPPPSLDQASFRFVIFLLIEHQW